MEKPPFAAASIALVFPDQTQAAPSTPTAPAPARRARLDDLNPQFHCSVIGTCLSTAATRKAMRRIDPSSDPHDADLAVHHAAVSIAINGGAGAKSLTKALDDQHAATIRRFAAAATLDQLTALWSNALKTGEVPGAYWALMTHPVTSKALRDRAFGDVHMLSHLVGAANRADIRRLVALAHDNQALRDQVDDLLTRVTDANADRDAQTARLQAELAEARGQVARLAQERTQAAGDVDDANTEVGARLEREARLRRQAEFAAETAVGSLADTQGRLARANDSVQALQQEVRALEAELATSVDPALAGDDDAAAASPLDARVRGLRILYVGGRPSTLTPIRRLVERAGGEWLHHDGGLEDRKGLLAAMLPRAQMVVFPIDCIDHDSMHRLKRWCARQALPYRPLRTASVASFVAALSTVGGDEPLLNGAAVASRFCVRHG